MQLFIAVFEIIIFCSFIAGIIFSQKMILHGGSAFFLMLIYSILKYLTISNKKISKEAQLLCLSILGLTGIVYLSGAEILNINYHRYPFWYLLIIGIIQIILIRISFTAYSSFCVKPFYEVLKDDKNSNSQVELTKIIHNYNIWAIAIAFVGLSLGFIFLGFIFRSKIIINGYLGFGNLLFFWCVVSWIFTLITMNTLNPGETAENIDYPIDRFWRYLGESKLLFNIVGIAAVILGTIFSIVSSTLVSNMQPVIIWLEVLLLLSMMIISAKKMNFKIFKSPNIVQSLISLNSSKLILVLVLSLIFYGLIMILILRIR